MFDCRLFVLDDCIDKPIGAKTFLDDCVVRACPYGSPLKIRNLRYKVRGDPHSVAGLGVPAEIECLFGEDVEMLCGREVAVNVSDSPSVEGLVEISYELFVALLLLQCSFCLHLNDRG